MTIIYIRQIELSKNNSNEKKRSIRSLTTDHATMHYNFLHFDFDFANIYWLSFLTVRCYFHNSLFGSNVSRLAKLDNERPDMR